MSDFDRLIEHAFPLKQASLDSVHEKNVRHGHISTLHIWPARRPLAACRAALIATLLPDPGTPEKRKELCEKIGGRVVKKLERKKMPNGQIVEREKEVTEGGILHWGTETENKELLEWFRQEIRKVYGGRAPKVLDPFAGGGAIPLEAMRLGCEATAVDINPVAWFILKCTLEYPQKLAGKTLPLPDFILDNEEFMNAFYKAHPDLVGRTKPTKKQLKEGQIDAFVEHRAENTRIPRADLAWHVRAWGQWVLDNARRELAKFYPTYADFEPIDKTNAGPYEKQPMKLVPLTPDSTADIDSLNREFSAEYLHNKRNPRWIAKPTVAYLWARTVQCKNCRATIPLLKTRWLCKNDKKRVLLTITPKPDKSRVTFGIQTDVPPKGGNSAQKREHDRRVGAGTMSKSGAKCPCCGLLTMTMEDIRIEGQSGRLGSELIAVAVDGDQHISYRLPTTAEMQVASDAINVCHETFEKLPYGIPNEPLPSKEALGFRIPLYGFDTWNKMFTARQLVAIGTLIKWTRNVEHEAAVNGAQWEFSKIVGAYLACVISRTTDYLATVCVWEHGAEEVKHVFMRWALPITWDYAEGAVLAPIERFYSGGLNSVFRVLQNLHHTSWIGTLDPKVYAASAISNPSDKFDLIVTDPPYYDAIPYSDLMDFFYVWLRRTLHGLSNQFDNAFRTPLSPKWDHTTNDGELIDEPSRHDGDEARSRNIYEDGMFRAFRTSYKSLDVDGRFVVVFANKQPEAWETLVSAIIRAGFVVDGSWPIQTEMRGGIRNLGRASLSSSVWLVCKKRPETTHPGWDAQVVQEMQVKIKTKLREYWDAGIRGPDFVWAATGPALEAYSKHPIVKKANDPGPMTVGEFLTHVRRIVVDFVVGRVLSGDKEDGAEAASGDRLDEPTAYYLLHRHDFGLDEAPAGACILYAISCGVSDKELADTWNLVSFTKGDTAAAENGDEEPNPDAEPDPDAESSGSKVKLKTWAQRNGESMGYEAPRGRPIPLIDRIHRLMHLWKSGDLHKVDEYLDSNALRRQELFKRVMQSLIELSSHGSEERSLLESLSNHIQAKGVAKKERPMVAEEPSLKFKEGTEDTKES